jgi:hypothetical protein
LEAAAAVPVLKGQASAGSAAAMEAAVAQPVVEGLDLAERFSWQVTAS